MRRRRVSGRTSTTLADVAFAANVSTASVSRALTRPDMVSDEIRLRVSRAAVTLGYVPNVAARALAGRRAGLIGVVLGDLERPGVADALTSLDERLDLAGWALIVRSCARGSGIRRARQGTPSSRRRCARLSRRRCAFEFSHRGRCRISAVRQRRSDRRYRIRRERGIRSWPREEARRRLPDAAGPPQYGVSWRDSDAAAFSAGARRGADASPRDA